MQYTKKAFLMSLLVSVSSYAQAADEQLCSAENHQAIAKFLNVSTEQLASRTLGSACKTDPNNSAETLVSYAVLEPKYTKENYQNDPNNMPSFQFVVARLKDNAVVQSWQQQGEIDALVDVNESSLKVDTARYILNKNVRAFGVRFNSAARGPSAPESSSGDQLKLFVPENDKLTLVFDYPMQTWGILNTQENKTERAEITLDIDAKKQSKGFNDIILQADITQQTWSKGVYAVDTTLKSESKRKEKVRLKFDGKQYSPINQKTWLGNF